LIPTNQLPENIYSQLPNDPYLYRGKDAASKFMDYVIRLSNLIGDLLEQYVPMIPLTDMEQRRFYRCTHCESCNSEFTMLRQPV